jgi:predicted RNase H-like nuclease (RuvC/YqgF family)
MPSMARKKPPIDTPRDINGVLAVIEDMRSEFRVYGDAIEALREETHRGFADNKTALAALTMEVRQNGVDIRKLTGRVDGLEGGVEKLDRRVERLDSRVERLEEGVKALGRSLT